MYLTSRHMEVTQYYPEFPECQEIKRMRKQYRYKALFSDLSNGPGNEANWYPEEQCMLVESYYVLHHLCTGILYSVDHAIYYVDLRNTKQPLHVLKGHSKAVSGIQFISPNEIVSS